MAYQEEVIALLKEIVAAQQRAQENQLRALAAQKAAIRQWRIIAVVGIVVILLYLGWSVVAVSSSSK